MFCNMELQSNWLRGANIHLKNNVMKATNFYYFTFYHNGNPTTQAQFASAVPADWKQKIENCVYCFGNYKVELITYNNN